MQKAPGCFIKKKCKTSTVVAIDLELVTEDILNNSAAWLKRQKIYKNLPKNPLNKGNIFEAACFVLHRF